VTWTLTIPRALPSQNRAPHNTSPMASHQYRRAREAWARDIRLLAFDARVPLVGGHYEPRRRVTITRLWGKGQRALDLPNAWGGAKLVIDVLCPPKVFRRRKRKGGPVMEHLRPGCSLIVDDSPTWADITVNQERAPDGKPATRITISNVEEP
jgi:hypothetical protein